MPNGVVPKRDEQRIHTLEVRLDAAIKEHRRMRAELDDLQARDPLADLRSLRAQEERQLLLAKRLGRSLIQPPSLDTSLDPDDTVN
jgi:hypothetical protein